ncbi:DEAD/DEAH box helicase [Shouchella miscanthi]|uniref:DEAD/DEAH box helicase n=1 Tax=Shouchella miscanthi TaxID=2598861 RepID=UPI0011A0AF1B|nr:DEAD/DEAH box helicase [Shouchella miscanthi]
MNQTSIWIHSGWVDQSFFIWAESKGQTTQGRSGFIYPFLYSPFELKLRLFQTDPISFYGTFLTLSRAIIHVPLASREFQSYVGSTIIYQSADSWKTHFFPIEGIELSLQEFVQFYPLFRTWKHDFQLADDFHVWLRFLDDVYRLIEEGFFEPNQHGQWILKVKDSWYTNWMNAMPKSTFSIAATQEGQQFAQQEDDDYDLARKAIMEAIIDAAIRSIVLEEDVAPVYDQWQQSVDEPIQPFLKSLKNREITPMMKHWHTHSFQHQLGLKQEEPFKTAIVLNEPQDNQNWTLSLALIDRTNQEQLVPVQQLLTGEHPWLTNPIPQLKKDLTYVQDAFTVLSGLNLSSPTVHVSSDEAYELFMQHEQFEQVGITLIVPNQLKQTPSIQVKLKDLQQETYNSVDPLLNWQSLSRFDYSIMIGSEEMSQADFEAYVNEQKSLLNINNQWLVWDPNLAERLKQFLDKLQHQYTYLDAWRLDQQEEFDELEDIDVSIEWSQKIQEKLPHLYRNEPSIVSIPSTLEGDLRTYQQQGFSWLVHLRQIGFGGCLADDMGLGKSIQTITYILYVLEQQEEKKEPFLLICPTSLLYNWEAECQKFAPDLNVFIHHGNDRLLEQDKRLYEYDLIITSYTLALRDESMLHAHYWNGLILDEAQHIKNKETKQRKAIRKLNATHRIALTGTPIENRLTELWSLMDLLNPSLLGTYKQFYSNYIKPIEKDRDEVRQHQLRTVIQPFLLRRTKETTEAELNLPAKHERLTHVPLSIEQISLYQAIVNDIEDQIHTVSTMERRALILRTITRLKQVCNHPAQFLKSSLDEHTSGKWQAFQSLIQDIYERGESTLIFTQYKEMGKLIRTYLEETYDASTSFLHGGLTKKQRLEAVQTFQESQQPSFFVLSLKAGGVGLNLTKATNVIHYDRWWNPAVENQATDRAYRIGQTDDVHVYKLLTEGTIEEKIDRMIVGKQHLADGILASSSQVTELSDDELLALLRLSS